MAKFVKVVRSVSALRQAAAAWRAAGESIALVPTMGALHDGHLSLVTLAKKKCRRTVVSIFVNPAQFAAHEDLSRYPRDEKGDLAKLFSVEADLVWAPDVAEMYPEGFSTRVMPGSAAEGLEGLVRPHHFAGVATVCCKLFSQVTPDLAIFGEKDYQQLCVLKQMVRDLNLPLKILGGPTERDDDGLALSSRNAYLTSEERKAAPALYAAIIQCAKRVAKGDRIASACKTAEKAILAAGFHSVDYVEARHAETLAPAGPRHTHTAKLRVLAAAQLGKTRLIDNVGV